MFLRCMLNTVIEQPWAVALMKLKWRTTHFTEGRKDPRTRCCTSLTFSPNEIIFYRDDFERNSLTPQWTKTCSSKWIIGHGRLQKAYKVQKKKKNYPFLSSPPARHFTPLLFPDQTKRCTSKFFHGEPRTGPYNRKNLAIFHCL